MSTTEQTFIDALLADAAYAENLTDGDSGSALVARLSPRLTSVLAGFIGDNFEVVSHKESSEIGSGFDATVWRGLPGKPFAGRLYVSMQGTLGLADYLADADLAQSGAARLQFVDMVNWWLRISTATGEPAPQIAPGNMAVGNDGQIQYFRFAAPTSGAGQLGGTVNLNVVGHSLGGHLASAFARIFGGSTTINQVSTFNSAGFLSGSEPVFNQLQSLLGMGTSGFATPQANYFAENGINVTTNTFWFSQIGVRVQLFNEEGTAFPNHYIYKLTDALALAAAIEKLDSSMTIGRVSSLFRAGANQMIGSLEGVLDGLRRVCLGESVSMTQVGDAGDSAQSRVAFHTNLKTLTESSAFRSLMKQVTIASTHDASVARNDFGALVSLVTGAPFSLRLNDPAPSSPSTLALFAAQPTLYERWLADLNLTPEQLGAGLANFSRNYLIDRAIWANAVAAINNRDATYTAGTVQDGLEPRSAYEDVASGITVSSAGSALGSPTVARIFFGGSAGESRAGGARADYMYGGGGDDTLEGRAGADWLEGNAGNDSLDGGAMDDALLGGVGSDTLVGDDGDDLLLGGTGADRYDFADNFGSDLITDPDMPGSVWVDNKQVTGSDTEKTSDTTWVAKDGSTYYTLVERTDGTGAAHQDLFIDYGNYAAKAIYIEDWVQDKLAIHLPDKPAKAGNSVSDTTNTAWREAVTFRPRDPLAIDLDGDGIETVGINPANPTVFDHNADGIRTATGWVRADDAWLVLDRDGNGSIDSGKELFGVDTEITVGGVTRTAASGFEALSALDTSADGTFDAADAQFAEVRLWSDANQDAISQAGELSTLAQASITSIGLLPSGGTMDLGNGNSITGQASVTRSSGASTTVGSVVVGGDSKAGNLNLSENPFYREFATPVPLTAQAQALPDMYGSGWVRDLREAMSLGTPEAQALVVSVAAIAAATTHDAQMSALDQLILDWARTNQTRPVTQAVFTNTNPSNGTVDPNAGLAPQLTQALPVLEVFNGQALQTANAVFSVVTATNTVTGQSEPVYVLIGPPATYLQAYEALRDSVFGALAVQTRLRPYLGAVQMLASDGKVRPDSAGVAALLESTRGANPDKAFGDLLDLIRYAPEHLRAARFDGLSVLAGWVDGLPTDSPQWATLASLGVLRTSNAAGTSSTNFFLGSASADVFSGGGGNDAIYGAAGADLLSGDAGNDLLSGGEDDDALSGGDGADTLNGGAGEDALNGGTGNNVYLFGRDDGQDSIAQTYDPSTSKLGTLRFKAGVAPGDLTLTQLGGSSSVLMVQVAGTSDQVTIDGFFLNQNPTNTNSPVQRFEFENGTVWYVGDIVAAALSGTAGNDNYRGTVFDDTIAGQGGNDTLDAEAGDDHLDGGAGNDTLRGGLGNNIYLFGRGDGQDLISSFADTSTSKLNTLRFKVGVAPSDVTLKQVDTGAGFLNSLQLGIAGTTDSITIGDFFGGRTPINPNNPIQQLEFADGIVWDLAQIQTQLFAGTAGNDIYEGTLDTDAIYGQGGDDHIWGGPGADSLYGGEGNDTLEAVDGDDLLDGGPGIDVLDGRTGNNRYLFGRGDGQDTILSWTVSTPGKLNTLQFKPGVVPGDLTLKQTPGAVLNNLRSIEVGITGTPDKITIKDFFAAADPLSPGNPIQQFEFDDGTLWNLSQIQAALFAGTPADDIFEGSLHADAIHGQDGNDSISGGGYGDDTLDGGAGLDTLVGGFGNDTLIDGEVMSGFLGSDTYVLQNWQTASITESIDSVPDADVLILPATSTASTVQVIGRDTNSDGRPDDLDLKDAGSSSEVTLSSYFSDPKLWVDSIRLGDGTVWTATDIGLLDATHGGTAGNDTLRAYNWGGSMSGLGGNDTLYGYTANDALDGGTGNDYLRGDLGADTLTGGAGNDTLDGDFSSTATGPDGADLLDGGEGNDTLFGGGGNDIYRFGRGDGADRVTDTAGANRVLLDAGIAVGDVTLFKEGSNLVIVIDQSATQMTIVDQFPSGGARISAIEFADGTVWDAAAIQARTVAGIANAMTGTAGNDVFVVDDVGDTITEAAGQGTDTVQSSVSYTLPSNVENLTLTGYLNASLTGNAENNTLTGNLGHNTLYGVDGADTLVGGAGDDTYIVNGTAANLLFDYFSNETVVEATGGGTDSVQTAVYDYTLPANVENLYSTNNWARSSGGVFVPRQLIGNALDNLIVANVNPVASFGAYIDGGAGADTMFGTHDNDTYVIDNLGDVIVETGSSTSDTVITSFDYTVGVGIENVTLSGSSTVSATGNGGTNVLDGAANAATNVLAGGLGDDTYRIGAGDVVVEQAGQGTDSVVIASGAVGSYSIAAFANVENLTLADAMGASGAEGNDADNVIFGSTSSNVLSGLGGNDQITDAVGTTDAGHDTLLGGAGNDTLTSFYGQDVMDGGAGDDVLRFARQQATGTVVFGKGMGHDVAEGGWATAVKRVQFKADTLPGELLFTRSGPDLVATVAGTGDTLTLKYFFVDDVSWTPTGEFGTFEFASDGVQLSAAAIASRAQNGNVNLATPGDDLLLGGSGSDTLVGAAGSDNLLSEDGDDELTGGLGGDTLYGGLGSDIYRFANGDGFDTIRDAGGANDRVRFTDMPSTAISVRQIGNDLWFLQQSTGGGLMAVRDFFTSAALEIEAAEFSDAVVWDNATLKTMASQITGTSGADSLTGSAAADRIHGLAGNDTLIGLDGDDLLDGGAGTDRLEGGLGNDTFIVDSTSDVIVESSGQGADTVQSSANFTLATNVENLTLTGSANINATGNSLANVLIGNAGNNTLSGGTGADTMIGGAGNDTFVIDNAGDVITELTGEGTDLVQSGISITALAANVENLTLTGTSGLSGTGNAIDNVLTGNSGANTLTGGAGDDRLDGGSGNDTMIGGAGDDTYVVNVSTDVVTELAGEGTDTIESTATLTLGSGNTVENLRLMGSGAINATGNGLANVLTGNSGNNRLTGNAGDDTLDGGTGTDTLLGGAGNDIYVVERSADVTTENANEGTDTVLSSVTRTLGSNLENLTLTGGSAINGTGNTVANVLIGNSGANTLAGLAGNDTYDGGAGNDTLNDTATTSSNDTYNWGIGYGVDTITDAGGADTVQFGAGITAAQLVFSHVGNNLEVTISGNSADKLVVTNHYVGTANKIETFRLSDGSTVGSGQIPLSVVNREQAAVTTEANLAPPRERIMPVARDQDGTTALAASAAVLRTANTLPWKLWTMRDAMWIDDDAPIAAAPRITDAVMLRQAHGLVSAMAAFGANDQAVLDGGRQTALPVHRTEPVWGVPALTP